MSITTFVERAIWEASSKVVVSKTLFKVEDENTSSKSTLFDNLDWTDFWDPDEGLRTIKLLNSPNMQQFTSYEEDQLLLFIKEHWFFFSSSEDLIDISREHVNALWPTINEDLEAWLNGRDGNPECMWKGLAMRLEGAGLGALHIPTITTEDGEEYPAF